MCFFCVKYELEKKRDNKKREREREKRSLPRWSRSKVNMRPPSSRKASSRGTGSPAGTTREGGERKCVKGRQRREKERERAFGKEKNVDKQNK